MTVVKLYQMIEFDLRELGYKTRASRTPDNSRPEGLSIEYLRQDKLAFVTFEKFLAHYRGHFPRHLTHVGELHHIKDP